MRLTLSRSIGVKLLAGHEARIRRVLRQHRVRHYKRLPERAPSSAPSDRLSDSLSPLSRRRTRCLSAACSGESRRARAERERTQFPLRASKRLSRTRGIRATTADADDAGRKYTRGAGREGGRQDDSRERLLLLYYYYYYHYAIVIVRVRFQKGRSRAGIEDRGGDE